jgi:hypothetical protein
MMMESTFTNTPPTIDGQSAVTKQRKRIWRRPDFADPLRFRINGKFKLGRRVRRQFTAYRSLLGNPVDILTLGRVAEAAELAIAVQDMRARLLAGEDVEESLVRLTNIHARAELKLGLPGRDAEPKPASVPLRDRLAAEAEQAP